MSTSQKTAIKRKKHSAPMKWLLKNNLITGKVLDYGCGHGEDADFLGYEKYDPFWFPKTPKGKFDTITCNYVLNVIPSKEERESVCKKIKSLLKPNGIAYISVRRDIEKEGVTPKGFQANVLLDPKTSIYLKSGRFEIYKITK